MVLVNGVEAWLEADGQRYPLSMQRYMPDVIYPDLTASLARVRHRAVADMALSTRSTHHADSGRVRQQGDARNGFALAVGRRSRSGFWHGRADLKVRPLLSGRDYHALHHENAAFNFNAQISGDQACVSWQPYGDLPVIHAATNGVYTHAPDWYRNFCYVRERERGLDFSEDLATPGVFSFNLADGDAVMIFSASIATCRCRASQARKPAAAHAAELARIEQQRRSSTRLTPATFRRCLRRRAQRRPHDPRGFPMVHRLGPRHLHRDARLADRIGPPRRGRSDPARMVGHAVRRHAAEPLPRLRRHAGIQLRRCIVMVRRRRPRLSGDESRQRRRPERACSRPSKRSSRATRRARASTSRHRPTTAS